MIRIRSAWRRFNDIDIPGPMWLATFVTRPYGRGARAWAAYFGRLVAVAAVVLVIGQLTWRW